MKTLATTTSIALLLSLNLMAENIDGTLAVDSHNKLTTVQQSAQNSSNTLSAGLDDAGDSMKTTVQATSTPVATTGNSGVAGPFVGIELNGVLASDAEGVSASGVSYGIRFGAQNIDWRTMAILERFSNDGASNSYTRGILQLDYYFLGMDNLMIDTYGIRPYAGLNAGLLSFDTPSSGSSKSLTYGGQLGATMNVSQNIDFDLGYRYNLSSDDKIDHTSGITAGLHYKY